MTVYRKSFAVHLYKGAAGPVECSPCPIWHVIADDIPEAVRVTIAALHHEGFKQASPDWIKTIVRLRLDAIQMVELEEKS